MKWLIAADSGCNITNIASTVADFKAVPLSIMVGDKEYIDNESINTEELMEAVYAYEGKTGTACPSPDSFRATFDGYDNIIVFTLTSGLSGSYNSAVIAKNMELEVHPEKNIEIVDSLNAGPPISVMIYHTVKLIEKLKDFNLVKEALHNDFKHFHLGFILDHLDNFVKNGRVNKLVAATVGVLGIRIVGTASKEGTLAICHKARNFNIAIKKLISDMEEAGYHGGQVILSHFHGLEGCEKIKDFILSKYPMASISIMNNGGLCSYYAEKGGILVGYSSL